MKNDLYFLEYERLTRGQFGAVSVTMTPKFRKLEQRKNYLIQSIQRLPPIPKPNNFCPCGSGIKYKKCCGQ